LIRGFIYREDAMYAVNECGEPLRPSDVLPNGGRYKDQIKPLYAAWLIVFLDDIRAYGWPDMTSDDNYTDRSGKPHDPKEVALAFTAEISTRLDACGRDGRVCQAYYKDNRMPEDVRATWYEFGNDRGDRAASVLSIHYMIKNALLYCSGRRKKIPYVLWLKKRQGRGRVTRVEVA